MKHVIFALTLLVSMTLLPLAGYCQGPKLAVFPFKNNGQAQLNSLAAGIAAMVTTDLTATKGITVVEPQVLSRAIAGIPLAGGAPSVADAMKVSAALNADFAVTGEFVSFGNRIRIDIRLYDVKTGTLAFAGKAQNKEEAMFDMVDELSGKVSVFIVGQAPAEGGILLVTTEPDGASISVDDEDKGNTPVKLTQTEGKHTVLITLDGYQEFTKEVTILEKETTKLEVKLVKLYGGVRVWWKTLPTSDVNISGEVVPMSLFTNNDYFMVAKYCKNMPSGTYTVTVRLPQRDESSWDTAKTWKTYTAPLDLTPGEVKDIFINNDLYNPGIQISPCGGCSSGWDYSTKLSWYEQ